MKRLDISDLEKKTRALVIREYVRKNKIQFAVCFSCGNASRKLKDVGVNLLDISPSGDFNAKRWFSQEEIRNIFPTAFDATSGHLPIDIMLIISEIIKKEIQIDLNEEYEVPTGSGETFVVLSLAYPTVKFVPVYNESEATQYEPNAPLNALVNALQHREK